ncbi:hypothetical protein [Allonocardiopsis opalescens]|uniref:HEAT repeat protein n=1 Tax=Allonocardiopsis opalescens TaxID=1144618 RepID=A0A2T0PU20_9ACTN|nr:hypothetical protein [Allonocardiopsis opalescens]PRX92399.1 hypothetical protein CLV72_110159 [Allonocardiopsis opalescens]
MTIGQIVDANDESAPLGGFLAAQEPAWLAEQLLRIADDDPVVRVRLLGAAGADGAVPACRELLERAVTGFVPYVDDDALHVGDGGWERLERALGALEDLIEYGYAAEVARLAAEAVELYERTHGDAEGEHGERLAEIAESAAGPAGG